MIIILDIDDKYAGLLSITAAKTRPDGMDMSVIGADLKKGQYIRIDENGKLHQMNVREAPTE